MSSAVTALLANHINFASHNASHNSDLIGRRSLVSHNFYLVRVKVIPLPLSLGPVPFVGHLPGFFGFSLKQRLLLMLAGDSFPFFFSCFTRAIFFPYIFALVPCTSILSSSIYYYSCIAVPKAQHSKDAKQERADQNGTTQASRQIASTALQHIPQAQHSTAQSARTKP